MELFFKFINEFLKSTKSIWLVLLGAGIAIYTHNKTAKMAMRKTAEKQKRKLRYKNELDKVSALKELYKLILEVSSLYSIFMSEVEYKISRKKRDALSEKTENIKINIIEKLSTASMLIEFYAAENNIAFSNYQNVMFKGFKVWDNYKLVDRIDKNFLHRYSKAQLDIIHINIDKLKKYEYLLQSQIGNMGRQIISVRNPYEDLLDELCA